MNRKILVMAMALIACTFSATTISPAFATAITYTEHGSVVGEGIQIDVPGFTPATGVRFSFAHFDRGNHGIRDNLGIYLWAPNFPGGARWTMTTWISDTDEGAAYIGELMAGSNVKITQLKPWQLQVCMIGKTAIAYWTTPLEAPAVPAFGMPAITIPPGCIVLKGYGDLRTGGSTAYYAFSGFTFSTVWSGYSAEGFFVCPKWHYCGPIGGTDPTLRTDLIQTATHP
jgi:hypothetical protein